MTPDQGERKFSRREFLRGAARGAIATGIGLLIGCEKKTPAPDQNPQAPLHPVSEVQRPITATPAKPEVTPTPKPETREYQGVTIDETILLLAFSGIGGGGEPGIPIPVLTPDSGHRQKTEEIPLDTYAKANWGPEVRLSEEGFPIGVDSAARLILSSACLVGADKSTTIRVNPIFTETGREIFDGNNYEVRVFSFRVKLPQEGVSLTLGDGTEKTTIPPRVTVDKDATVIVLGSDVKRERYVLAFTHWHPGVKTPELFTAVVDEKTFRVLAGVAEDPFVYDKKEDLKPGEDLKVRFSVIPEGEEGKENPRTIAATWTPNVISEGVISMIEEDSGLDWIVDTNGRHNVPYPPKEMLGEGWKKSGKYQYERREIQSADGRTTITRGIYAIESGQVVNNPSLVFNQEKWTWEKPVIKQPEKVTQGNLEKVNWTADEIDDRIKAQEAVSGRNVVFWPVEQQFTSAEVMNLSLNGSPRLYWGFDVPGGTIVRSPISGKAAFIFQTSGQVKISILEGVDKSVSFFFADRNVVKLMYQRTPGTFEGEVRVGEPLFQVQSGAHKMDRVGKLTPIFKKEQSFAMCVSNPGKQEYCVSFDWLTTEDGKIAR